MIYRRHLSFTLILLSWTGFIYASEIKVKSEITYSPTETKRASYHGSSLFHKCQEYASKDWAKMVAGQSKPGQDLWKTAWNELRETYSKNFNSLGDSSIENIVELYKNFNDDLQKRYHLVLQCEAMRSLTAGTDYTNEKSGKYGRMAHKQSLDGAIVCNSDGYVTQDYQMCLEALNAYDIALAGSAFFQQAEGVKYQADTSSSLSGLNPNDPTSGLKAQKEDIQNRARISERKSAIDTTKIAALGTYFYRMPTHDSLLERCNDHESNSDIAHEQIFNGYQKLVNEFYGEREAINPRSEPTLTTSDFLFELSNNGPTLKYRQTPALSQSAIDVATNISNAILPQRQRANSIANRNEKISSYCRSLASSHGPLIKNTEALDGLKNAMIAAGVDATASIAAANQLKKQASQVGSIINEVNNFNPEEFAEYQPNEFYGDECALNPSAEGCEDYVEERSFGFQDSNPIQIHGLEKATTYGRNDNNRVAPNTDSSTSSTDRSGASGGIDIIEPGSKKGSGFEGRMPAPAEVTSDGPDAPGGGGGGAGGGVAGGGSPPPPMNAPGSNQEGGGPKMSDAGDSVASYSGGRSGVRVSGGAGAQGRRGQERDENGNPFEKLFGKDGPKGGETLSFRETASDSEGQINTPDTSIFEIISDRYAHVQEEKRLLEYELAQEKELK